MVGTSEEGRQEERIPTPSHPQCSPAPDVSKFGLMRGFSGCLFILSKSDSEQLQQYLIESYNTGECKQSQGLFYHRKDFVRHMRIQYNAPRREHPRWLEHAQAKEPEYSGPRWKLVDKRDLEVQGKQLPQPLPPHRHIDSGGPLSPSAAYEQDSRSINAKAPLPDHDRDSWTRGSSKRSVSAHSRSSIMNSSLHGLEGFDPMEKHPTFLDQHSRQSSTDFQAIPRGLPPFPLDKDAGSGRSQECDICGERF